jgi:hypothetical protein
MFVAHCGKYAIVNPACKLRCKIIASKSLSKLVAYTCRKNAISTGIFKSDGIWLFFIAMPMTQERYNSTGKSLIFTSMIKVNG